jgi:hypothetical protein
MTIKCDSLQKIALFVLDILILICLLGLIACDCMFLKSEKISFSDKLLSIIFFSLSFLSFFIFFIINIKKDYLDNNGCRTVFRFISYGFTLYGFIIIFQKQPINGYSDIFFILGILVMIFLFISFLIGFFILNPETDIENMEKSQMSTFIPLIYNSKEE